MKRLLLLCLVFIVTGATAQTYVRTRHNAGLVLSYSPFDLTERPASFRSDAKGSLLMAGVTKQMAGILYPEVFYLRHEGRMPYTTEGTPATPFNWNGIGAGLTAKFDVLVYDKHKRGGNCFARVLNVVTGMEYVMPFSASAVPYDVKLTGEAAAKLGFGSYSVWGGSARNHKAWTVHWEMTYRYGLSPFIKVADMPHPGLTDAWTHNSVSLTLRVIRHKVYKFSEM